MTELSEARGKYTVEGFVDGDWELMATCDDRETAVTGAGSVAAGGDFDFVRLSRRDAKADDGWRELVRIDRNGTVRNGAFVASVPEPAMSARRHTPVTVEALPSEPLEKAARKSTRRDRGRPAVAIAGAMLLLVAGIAVGNWAIRVI